MARTFIRQSTQIRNSDVYNDTITPSSGNYVLTNGSIEDDLNTVRSQLQNLINRNGASFPSGHWYDDLSAPVSYEGGAPRGVQQLNSSLHDLERKRVLVSIANLTDVTVGVSANYAVLTLGQLPSNVTASIGAVTTLGTVAAYNSSFGSHSLEIVSGTTSIAPKNLCEIVDGDTRDPILSSNRVVYALFQTESNTDGSTMTGTTPTRAQLSFVRINSTGDALEAVPAADIQGKKINYSSQKRTALSDLNEQDFLRGAILDNLGATIVTRQVSYDQQGVTPVKIGTNAVLDLSSGLYWDMRDNTGASLFRVTEDSSGGTTTVGVTSDVDYFTVNAASSSFAQGVKIATGGTQINVGVTAGTIETTSTSDLRVFGAGNLYLDDGNQTTSTWSQTSGIKLSTSATEWNTFKTNFGEVSVLNAINASYTKDRRSKTYAFVTTAVPADTNVSLADGNLDTALPDMSTGTFTSDYDVYLNGELLNPGANSSTNNDYYPGSTLATAAKLKFEFALKSGDVLCVIKSA